MSTVKAKQLQLGDNVDATQNFVWQTNNDGTAKLARGNVGATTQDILTVDAAGVVSMPNNPPSGGIGVDQTWQVVTGSRALGTTYTNDTGKPISVAVSMSHTANTTGTTIVTIGGVAVYSSSLITGPSLSFKDCAVVIVPVGATYAVTGANAAISAWSELR